MDVGKKKAAVNTDDVVKQALLKLATAECAMRLSGKGDHPALFASAAGANKAAIAKIKDEARPLVEEVGSGKGATATLTDAGFELVGVAAKEAAESLPLGERIAFIQGILPKVPTAAPGLEPLLAEAVRQQEAETAARIAAEKARAERAEATRAAVQRCLDHLAKLQSARIEELKALLLAAGGTVPVLPPPSQSVQNVKAAPPQTKAQPATAEDRDFRRDVANQLTSSWRATWEPNKPDAREFLEAAIWNISGFRQVGEPGERVKFDGRYHEGGSGVFTGDPVRVVRPGWVLEEDDDREYVALKALVEK